MYLAPLLGLALGLVLNICADRLPRGVAPRPWGPHRAVRWASLLAITVGLCAYLQQSHGWSSAFAVLTAYCSLLLLIAVIDLEHSLIPNVLIGSGSALALGLNIWHPAPGLGAALWGAVTGGGVFGLLALARRNALGAGDVKLAFLIGMMTGFPWVLQALTLGILAGGLAAGLLMLTRIRQPKQYMPYAPYLAVATMATLLHGQGITSWYARLFGWGG